MRFISRPETSTSMPQLREQSMQAVGSHWPVVAVELIEHLRGASCQLALAEIDDLNASPQAGSLHYIFNAASRHDFRI
jgi:hypothetical protein